MSAKKPIAIFDIDGTIFRSSLILELFKKLTVRGVISKNAVAKVKESEARWLDRTGNYDDYMWASVNSFRKEITGKSKQKVVAASKEVIAELKYRTYRFTLDLLNRIRKKYFTIAISGSIHEVVSEYNKFLKFDKIYATEMGVDEKRRYTGTVLHEPPKYKKELIIRYMQSHDLSLKNSVGVGDTESDIGFLEVVDNPIAFNPNRKLAEVARHNGWPIVIERKDLIVQLSKSIKILNI